MPSCAFSCTGGLCYALIGHPPFPGRSGRTRTDGSHPPAHGCTGYAAASAFAKAILEKEEGAVEKYINNFLKSGGSNYPIEILKSAGVDMTTSQPLEATMERFNELLDMLEEVIN